MGCRACVCVSASGVAAAGLPAPATLAVWSRPLVPSNPSPHSRLSSLSFSSYLAASPLISCLLPPLLLRTPPQGATSAWAHPVFLYPSSPTYVPRPPFPPPGKAPSSSPPLGQHSLVDDPPLSLHPSRFTGLDQDDVQESLSHCLLTCPRVFPIVQSLKRILRIHCGVSISYESELLFSCSSLPADGFPLFLLQILSFYHIWIARCESRFNSKRFHPKALLQIILSSFLNHCTSHFSHLCNSTSKYKKKLLLSHRKAAVKFSVLTFPSPSIPVLHPLFKRHWLLCEPFHPP